MPAQSGRTSDSMLRTSRSIVLAAELAAYECLMLVDNGMITAIAIMSNAAMDRTSFDLRSLFMHNSPNYVNHKTTNLPEIESPPKKREIQLRVYILNH